MGRPTSQVTSFTFPPAPPHSAQGTGVAAAAGPYVYARRESLPTAWRLLRAFAVGPFDGRPSSLLFDRRRLAPDDEARAAAAEADAAQALAPFGVLVDSDAAADVARLAAESVRGPLAPRGFDFWAHCRTGGTRPWHTLTGTRCSQTSSLVHEKKSSRRCFLTGFLVCALLPSLVRTFACVALIIGRFSFLGSCFFFKTRVP